MAAWRSLDPKDRVDTLRELADTVAARQRYQQNLARLVAERKPRSFQGKLRYQIRACERHEARFRRMLDEVAA